MSAPPPFTESSDPSVVPARFLRALDRFDWDYATIKVDWALSQPIPWSEPEARYAGTVHLGVAVEGFRNAPDFRTS